MQFELGWLSVLLHFGWDPICIYIFSCPLGYRFKRPAWREHNTHDHHVACASSQKEAGDVKDSPRRTTLIIEDASNEQPMCKHSCCMSFFVHLWPPHRSRHVKTCSPAAFHGWRVSLLSTAWTPILSNLSGPIRLISTWAVFLKKDQRSSSLELFKTC